MSMIQNDWLEPLKPEFSKPYYAELFKFVKNEYSHGRFFRLRTTFSTPFI